MKDAVVSINLYERCWKIFNELWIMCGIWC